MELIFFSSVLALKIVVVKFMDRLIELENWKYGIIYLVCLVWGKNSEIECVTSTKKIFRYYNKRAKILPTPTVGEKSEETFYENGCLAYNDILD